MVYLFINEMNLQRHLEALETFKGEYQANQEKRLTNYRSMMVLGCIFCMLIGLLAAASWWHAYGYPPYAIERVQEVRR